MKVWLKLVRFPAPLTAPCDVLAGAALAGGGLPPWPVWLASLCFYSAGMAGNDVADRRRDAELRSDRPIPAGEISALGAALGVVLLLAAGLGLCALVGQATLAGGGAVVAAVLLYNGLLKASGPGGILGMVLCRVSNLLLGAIAVAGLDPAAAPLALWVGAGAAGGYVAGLTLASLAEDSELARGWRRLALALMLLALAGGALAGMPGGAPWWATLAAAGLALIPARKLALAWPALRDGPAGAFVGAGVRGVALLDASLALSVGAWPQAAGCLGLAGLAALWGRRRVD